MAIDPKAMNLPVKLTPDEIRMNAEKIGELVDEKDSIEAEKKRAVDGFKTRLDHADAEIRRRSKIARTGEELRLIPTVAVKDYASKTVRIHRTDTNAEVDSRPMEFEELQAELSIEPKGKKRKPSETTVDVDADPVI